MSISRLTQGLRILLLGMALLCRFTGFMLAQPKVDSVAKAYKLACTDCEDWLKKGKNDRALLCYERLVQLYPTHTKGFIRLAELNYQRRDLYQTLHYANTAIDLNANEAYSPITYLANKMKTNKDDELAIQLLNRLSVSDLDSTKLQKVEKRRLDMNVNQVYDKTPVPGVSLYSLGDSINTKDDEYFPSLSLDEHILLFTRKINGANEDFFMAQKDSNKKWLSAKNMGTPPNTGMPDGAVSLSADGNYLFYTRCDMRSPNGIESGGCDLVFSYREEDGWSSPQYFGYTINTTGYEGQPCLSSNNEELYFVSNREGGYGGLDIWVSKFVNNFWTKPINLGPTINTPGNETAPFIHPDNESFYFVSDRHPGLGASDIFLSRKNKNGTWKKPINLGAPINSDKFESSIAVNARGTEGYIAANRSDSKGGMDIYSFSIYPAIAPVPTVCLKGYLLDKYFKTKLYERKIDFTYLYNGLNMGSVLSNEGDGSYAKALQMGKKYLIKIEEPGYRTFYKTIELTNDSLPNTIYMNLRLKQPGYKDSLYNNTLKMDSTHLALDSLSQDKFDSIIAHWPAWTEDSATVIIYLKGYYYSGDSTADSMFQFRLEKCKEKLNFLATAFEKHKIKCDIVMQDLDMIIYNDDEELFDTVDIKIVEFY
jgi:hypothetical protein